MKTRSNAELVEMGHGQAVEISKQDKLNELCARYIVGVVNYDQLISRGKRLGFTEQEIRSNADDPQY